MKLHRDVIEYIEKTKRDKGKENNMAKASKEFEWRMQGMLHALDVAKKEGVDALEEEIRRRGFFRLPIALTQSEYDKVLDYLVQNLHSTYKTVTGIVLNDIFGFGKKRLTEFEIAFDRKTRDAVDFDYLGQHYMTLEDYAKTLNNDFGMHIDIERVKNCQELYKGEDAKNMADIKVLTKVLRENGYEDAAQFIEEKL